MSRLIILGVLLALVPACHENKDAEGPMERAGKQVDHAAETTSEKLKEAAKDTDKAARRAVKNTGAALKEAGEKLEGNSSPAPAPSAAPKKSE